MPPSTRLTSLAAHQANANKSTLKLALRSLGSSNEIRALYSPSAHFYHYNYGVGIQIYRTSLDALHDSGACYPLSSTQSASPYGIPKKGLKRSPCRNVTRRYQYNRSCLRLAMRLCAASQAARYASSIGDIVGTEMTNGEKFKALGFQRKVYYLSEIL